MGASTSGLQGKSERQHSGSKSRYLFFGDDFSLPFVLQIFKGHPLFTKISVQIIGKGLEVVASPADPRLLRYVSLAWKLQGDFFNWASLEFAKCWPVSNQFQKNGRVPDWPPLMIEESLSA